MNSTIITALAAVCGSLVGTAASIVTTWITQRTQTAYAEREETLRHRETLYGEFITEASRLTLEAVSHVLEQPETAHSVADWAGSVTRYQYAGLDGKRYSEEVSWKGHPRAVQRLLSDIQAILPNRSALAAVGHRVVHLGPFTASVRITPETRSRIAALADLAPLHNAPSLETVAAAEAELPGVPQVAVFDTAFHATLPPEASTYPIPGS